MINKISVFLTLTFATLTVLFGQKSVDVTENVKTMSLGDRTGYTITLNGMSEKDAMKTLRTWASDQQKKPDIDETGKHELKINGFSGGDFSAAPANIYFLMEETKESLIVTGYFESGGVFISSTTNAAQVETCRKMMTRFAYRVEKTKIETELSAAKKALEDSNEEQQSLEKKQNQLNGQISDCEETIKKAKSELEQNSTDQKNNKEEIGKQQTTVSEIEKQLAPYQDY